MAITRPTSEVTSFFPFLWSIVDLLGVKYLYILSIVNNLGCRWECPYWGYCQGKLITDCWWKRRLLGQVHRLQGVIHKERHHSHSRGGSNIWIHTSYWWVAHNIKCLLIHLFTWLLILDQLVWIQPSCFMRRRMRRRFGNPGATFFLIFFWLFFWLFSLYFFLL